MSIVHVKGLPVVVYSGQASDILDRDYWVLTKDMCYTIILGDDLSKADSYVINIERGYLTDGATVPRSLWSFVPVWDDCTEAVIMHDYLCNYGKVTKNGKEVTLERPEIDKLFLTVLKNSKVAKIKYWTMYVSVRAHSVLTKTNVGINPKKKEMELLLRDDIDSGIFFKQMT